MCLTIHDTSEEGDNENNPLVNSKRGDKHEAEGEIETAAAGREKVYFQEKSGA
jgi:hypothetical protein